MTRRALRDYRCHGDAGDDVFPRCLGRDHKVDPGRAALLGNPADGGLHIAFGLGHHDIRQLVDDDDQKRKFPGNHIALFIKIRLILHRPVVESLQIFRLHRRENLVAPLHLVDSPAESKRNQLRIVHHRRNQVRERTVHRKFHMLRVDQDQTEVKRRKFRKQTHNQRVHADAFSASGRSGNQQMRRPGKIGDHRLSRHIASENDRNVAGSRLCLLPLFPLQERADVDIGRHLVRHLDSHGVLPGNRCENADALRLHFHRDVVGDAGHLLHLR